MTNKVCSADGTWTATSSDDVFALIAALRTVRAQIQPGDHAPDVTGALITIDRAIAQVQS